MTREDVSKIFAVITAVYPGYYKNVPTTSLKALSGAAERVWKDYTYEQISASLDVYLSNDTKGFPPSPGQLVDILYSHTHKSEQSALEAWALVRKALSASGYYSIEEYEKLPELCRKAVGAPENLKDWAMLDTKTVDSVIQSQFIRAYDVAVTRARDEAKIPESMKQLTQRTVQMLEAAT